MSTIAVHKPVLPRRTILLVLLLLISSCSIFPRKPDRGQETVLMVVTAYCACQKCCGWKRSIWSCCLVPVYSSGPSKGKRKRVGITSDGTKAKKGTIAADISRYPYGTEMHIPGYGWGVVHDRGSGIRDNHIDIFFTSHKKALKWGRRELPVTIRKR